LECDLGGTRGRVPSGSLVYLKLESDHAPESSHREGKGSMEELQPDEATWELEDAMREAYPFLLSSKEH